MSNPCSACGHPEPQFRCSETHVPYCNQECQTIDARLTKQQKAKVSRVMREFAAGTLKSGSGKTVTDRKQALAIAYSEARRL